MKGKVVESVTVREAVTSFIDWLKSIESNKILLCAHNAKKFDVHVVLLAAKNYYYYYYYYFFFNLFFFLTENSMRYTLHSMVATTCDIKHKPPHYTTPENRLTD